MRSRNWSRRTKSCASSYRSWRCLVWHMGTDFSKTNLPLRITSRTIHPRCRLWHWWMLKITIALTIQHKKRSKAGNNHLSLASLWPRLITSIIRWNSSNSINSCRTRCIRLNCQQLSTESRRITWSMCIHPKQMPYLLLSLTSLHSNNKRQPRPW